MSIAFLRRTLLFALAFGLGVFFALTIHTTKSPAGAYEKVICDYEPDPSLCLTIQNWYYRARTNDGGGCCGIGDAYWTDDTLKVTEKGLYVRVTDPRSCKGPVPGYDEESGAPNEDAEQQAGCIRKPDLDGHTLWIPHNKIDQKGQGNPSGHVVTFINAGGNSVIYDPAGQQFPAVYCFFPGAGG